MECHAEETACGRGRCVAIRPRTRRAFCHMRHLKRSAIRGLTSMHGFLRALLPIVPQCRWPALSAKDGLHAARPGRGKKLHRQLGGWRQSGNMGRTRLALSLARCPQRMRGRMRAACVCIGHTRCERWSPPAGASVCRITNGEFGQLATPFRRALTRAGRIRRARARARARAPAQYRALSCPTRHPGIRTSVRCARPVAPEQASSEARASPARETAHS